MKKIIISLLIFFNLLHSFSNGQSCTIGSRKGLYVEIFGNVIINNDTYLTNLQNYIIKYDYNYILLYNLENKVFSRDEPNTTPYNSTLEGRLRNFISYLKTQNPLIQIGAIGGATNLAGGPTSFFGNVDNYNSRVALSSTSCLECIDFNNLEQEYWGGSDEIEKYNRYFNVIEPILDTMHNIAHPMIIPNYPTPKAEIYLGDIKDIAPDLTHMITAEDQANKIDETMDRILLTMYIPDKYLQSPPCSVSSISQVDKLFLNYDHKGGHRLELFANNTKQTHILPLFSSESSIDPVYSDNHGNYLWFQGLNSDPNFIHTGTTDDVNTNFITNYNSDDPYYRCSNGNISILNCTLSTLCACTDYINNPSTGNIIDGVVWFKYGSMPFKNDDVPLFVSSPFSGIIQGDYGSTFTLTLNDNFSVINPLAQFEDANTGVITPLTAIKYNWYRDGFYVGTTFNNSYTMLLPLAGKVDIWTCELVTNRIPNSFFNHKFRVDIGFISAYYRQSIVQGVITQAINPTCPNYNNGLLTADVSNGTASSYLWSNGATTKSISGLSPGSYSVTISGSFGTTVRNIDLIENQNFPEPFVSTGDLFSNCSPNLETQSFASYQWNFNGQPISTANSQSYLATTPGEYSVTVTNSSQCSATSPVQIYNPSFSLSIVGKNSTCNNRFLGFSQNIITTSWTVPSGATFIKSGNLITVNWGTAISTSGTITCTATNDCGNITTSSILVYPFTAITNSTSTCPGLNIGKANVATLTGGTAPYSYHWSSGTSTTSQLMTNLSAGTYTVTVTDNNNCTTTASTVVNSFPSDMPAPIISGLAYSGAHLYTITNYNSAYDNYYSWNVIPNFGNATISYPNNNKESAIIVWPISGGVIHLTFGLTGCQLNTNFIVSSSYPPLPPNPKHPVEEFIERLSDPSVKSSDFTESADAINSFKLFPNPTTGKISLNYNLLSTENGLIEITNILGVSLYYKKLNPESQQLEIDLSELKPAIYFFKIVVDGKQIHQGKISIIR